MLRLRAGGRIVYKLVDKVDERVSGHGTWWDMHTALTVRQEEFLPNYRRMWEGIPEEEGYKADLNLSLEQQEALPARTGLHRSPVGLKWKEICDRGDEFYDWDCHSFHFMGGKPLKNDGSMALYEAIEQEEYLRELAESMQKSAQPGLMEGLGQRKPFQASRRLEALIFGTCSNRSRRSSCSKGSVARRAKIDERRRTLVR